MEIGSALAFGIGPVFDLVALASYLWWFQTPSPPRANLARAALGAALVSQLAGLLLLSNARGVLAPVSTGESLVALAVATTVLYLYVEWRSGEHGMGVFASALISGFALASRFFGPADEIDPVLRDLWFAPHASLILLSFASFTMSAMFSLAYMLVYRELRRKHTGLILARMPSLNGLDVMGRRAMRVGFLFLTLGLGVGMILAEHVWGRFWSWDPKQCMTLLTWMLYGVALILRRQRDWQGERVATANLVAFSSVVVGMIFVYALFDSAHRFG